MAEIAYTDTERFTLAATIWGEARGEGVDGMRAVAHVIMNRVKANRHAEFGTGIVEVATHPHQFSCWNQSDPNACLLTPYRMGKLDPRTPDGHAYVQAQGVVAAVLAGEADPTHGAIYYHTVGCHPYWDAKVTQVAKIGAHLFFI